MGSACIQTAGVLSHGSLGGLGVDDHTQYPLLAGRSGGQELTGGDASAEMLTLESTSHATKGGIRLAAGDWLEIPEVSAPATPSSGFGRFYGKTDGKPYYKNDAGTEYDLTTAGSTHALLSATHSDTLAASVVAGDLIIGNATPAWSRLAAGANGKYLKMVSGLPAWADAPGGFVATAGVLDKVTASDQVYLSPTGADEPQFMLSRGAAGTTANIVEIYEEDESTLLAAFLGAGGLDLGANELVLGASVGSGDVFLSRFAANGFQFGRTTAPAVQTLRGVPASGVDLPGYDVRLLGGPGTGTGAGGHVILSTAPAGVTGSSVNTAIDRVTVVDDESVVYIGNGETSTAPINGAVRGTGGQGPNKAGGDVYLAGGAPTGNAEGGDVHVQTAPSGNSGSALRTRNDRQFVRAQAKTLTDNVLAEVFQIAVATAGMVAGQIFYGVRASDGTDHQMVSGVVSFAAVNKAGTITVDVDEDTANRSSALSTGTLAVTWSGSDAGGGQLALEITANPSITPTTLDVFYQVVINGVGDVTPV